MLDNKYVIFGAGVLFAMFVLPMIQSAVHSRSTAPRTVRTV